jgi:hypothetical protein
MSRESWQPDTLLQYYSFSIENAMTETSLEGKLNFGPTICHHHRSLIVSTALPAGSPGWGAAASALSRRGGAAIV